MENLNKPYALVLKDDEEEIKAWFESMKKIKEHTKEKGIKDFFILKIIYESSAELTEEEKDKWL